MTREQIAELADKIQAECINWSDRDFDHDEAERLIRSALAAPAPQEIPLPEILCGACGSVLDVRRVDGRYLATGYCPQCDFAPPAREDRTKAHRWTDGPIVTCLDCKRYLDDDTRDRACIPPTPASAPEGDGA